MPYIGVPERSPVEYPEPNQPKYFVAPWGNTFSTIYGYDPLHFISPVGVSLNAEEKRRRQSWMADTLRVKSSGFGRYVEDHFTQPWELEASNSWLAQHGLFAEYMTWGERKQAASASVERATLDPSELLKLYRKRAGSTETGALERDRIADIVSRYFFEQHTLTMIKSRRSVDL